MKAVRFAGAVVYLLVAATFFHLTWKYLAHPDPAVTVTRIVICAVFAYPRIGAHCSWEKWRARR